MKKHSLAIVPTYNEKENIEDLIKSILEQDEGFDVLVVDDNSPDGTSKKVEKLQIKYNDRLHLIVREKKLGLGTAYIVGFKYALQNKYNYVYEIDADFSHNPKDLIRLYYVCKKEKYDVAVGSRYIDGVRIVDWPLSRILLSFFASKYVFMLMRMPIKDPTAGFVCYRRKVLKTINLDKVEFKGYAFQIEMKFLAWKYGFKLKEVPILFMNRAKGKSKMSYKIFHEAVFGVFKMVIASMSRDFRKNYYN